MNKYETYVKQRRQLKLVLLDTFTADQRELYETMEQAQAEINKHTNMEFYFMGFKMGGRFILEILGDGKVPDVSN